MCSGSGGRHAPSLDATHLPLTARAFPCALQSAGSLASGDSLLGGDVMDAETHAELIAMGIPSPVTKETAGELHKVGAPARDVVFVTSSTHS